MDAPTQGTDTIRLQNLQLSHGVQAPDVWGKPKEQPALVSLTLTLRNGFGSAADSDALDASTIHYGELAKRIRATCAEARQTIGSVSANVERIVCEMARKAPERFILDRSKIEVVLPKASMYGDGVTLGSLFFYDDQGLASRHGRRVFTVKEVKVMAMIGVNDYERVAKQPIVATCSLYVDSSTEIDVGGSEQTAALFQLEQILVQIIRETSFETLESLADFTARQLQSRMLDQMLPQGQVQLRLEKPRAIVWADAPAVEVFRESPGVKQIERTAAMLGPPGTLAVSIDERLQGSGGLKNKMARGDERQETRALLVIKPYARS